MAFFPKDPVADADYLLGRAAAEAESARLAKPGPSAQIHQRLASGYLDRLFDAPEPSAPAGGPREQAEMRGALFQQMGERLLSEAIEPLPDEFSALLLKLD